jgi:glutamine synthetase
VRIADKVQLYKYVDAECRRALWLHRDLYAQARVFQDNGSGMHTHQSLWKGGENLFYDERGYAMLSDTARYYIGGLLKHAPAILAFAAPTTNSYRRLVPGYEAPINLVYSQRNRSACIRIPTYSPSPKARRIEFRAPDPTANPYLAFAAMVMAGLDGIQNRIEPPDPIDKDLYELPPDERKGIPTTPPTLADALNALEQDHEFLMRGGGVHARPTGDLSGV